MRRRWQFGSEPHLLFELPSGPIDPWPWPDDSVRVGGGRHALALLIAMGMKRRGWRRVWMPSYFCQKVVASVAATGIDLALYDDTPLDAAPRFPSLRDGDVLFCYNALGLRDRPELPPSGDVVEDHSHGVFSPWASESRAAYCFASVRKAMPVPDGAFLWSPTGQALPAAPTLTSEHELFVSRQLQAMLLKTLYLDGLPVDKKTYRGMGAAAERMLDCSVPSSMSEVSCQMLRCVSRSALARVQRKNFEALAEALRSLRLRFAEPSERAAPFAAFVVLDEAAARDRMRSELIARDVYPAALWPLDDPVVAEVSAEHRDLARRSFALPCDVRYTDADITRVARILGEAGV